MSADEAPADVERAFEKWWSCEEALSPAQRANSGNKATARFSFGSGYRAGFAASAAERERLRGALSEMVRVCASAVTGITGHAALDRARAALSSGQGGEKQGG